MGEPASVEDIVAAAHSWHASGRRREFVRHAPGGFGEPDSAEVASYQFACGLVHRTTRPDPEPVSSDARAEALLYAAEAVRANEAGVHDRALRFALTGWARAVAGGVEPPAEVIAQLSRAAFHDTLVTRVPIGAPYVQDVDVSDDLALVAVTYPQHGCIVFDAATGDYVAWAAGSDTVAMRVAFAPGSHDLVFADQKSVYAWSFEQNEPPYRLAEVDFPRQLAFTPDGWRLAIADNAGAILCIAPDDGQVFFSVPAPVIEDSRPVMMACLAFRDDGRLLAVTDHGEVSLISHSGQVDRLARLGFTDCMAAFDRQDGRLWFAFERPLGDLRRYGVGWMPADGGAFEPDFRLGPLMHMPSAVAFAEGRFQTVDFDGRLRGVGPDDRTRLSDRRTVFVAPRGELFAGVDEEGVLSIWQPGRTLRSLPLGETVVALGFSRDAAGEHSLHVCPPPPGQRLRGLPLRVAATDAARVVERVVPGEPGTSLLGFEYDGAVSLRTADGERRVEGVVTNLRPMQSLTVALSPDGRLAAYGDEYAFGLIDLETFESLSAFAFETEGWGSMVGFLDGEPKLMRPDRGAIAIYDVRTGAFDRLVALPEDSGTPPAWLGESKIAVAGRRLSVVDLVTGETLARGPLPPPGHSREHHGLPRNRLMTRGVVWCAETGMRLADVPAAIVRVPPACSSDGRWLAVSGDGGSWLFDARWLVGLTGDALVEAICQERLGGCSTPPARDEADAVVRLPADPVGLCRRLLAARRS